jgi:hypothetical protein
LLEVQGDGGQRIRAESSGAMMSEFEQIEAIQSLADGKIGEELYFTHTEALQAVDICTKEKIAVLGVEIID